MNTMASKALYDDFLRDTGAAPGERKEVAWARGESHRSLIIDEVIRGRYLPWFIAVLALGALSIRVGIAQTVPMIIASCSLLSLLLVVVRWCSFEENSIPFGHSVSRVRADTVRWLSALPKKLAESS